ncbi:MAG: HAMP domain-containing sensor histidine kinase [Peptococcaceae bacterium]|nr:HAMP domain-containing sensor histidine kinase [Peptococcaceae bacterium]
MRWRSLDSGIRRTLLAVLAATILATLVTYAIAVAAFVAIQYRYVQPANYSEQRVNDVAALVQAQGAAVLDPASAANLDAATADGDLRYEVLDADGQALYGNYESASALDRQALLKLINTTTSEGDDYVRTVPIFDDDGTLLGAVRCAYKLELRFTRTDAIARLVAVFCLIALVSPVLYLLLFGRIFSRRFADEVRTPLALLRGATQKIQRQELDFAVDYHADNELGDLCSAFDEMRASLATSLERQWQLEQGRTEMVAALAHDLKTPLSVIKAYNEALADDTPVNTEQVHYLNVIGAHVDRASQMVRGLQDVIALDAAAKTNSTTTVDLTAWLAAREEAYALRARAKGISVRLARDGLASSYAICTDALARILDNLVGNSIEATPAGGRIDIDVSEGAGRLIYEVRDNGPGFSARDLRHATDEFYRGDEARPTADGHAGLGLYIARNLAAQMGGGLTLANNPDGGACVRFWHPALQEAGD